MTETERTVSRWWDIRAPNGDLLARIKSLSYEAALAKFYADEAKRQNSAAAEYSSAVPIFTGTLH